MGMQPGLFACRTSVAKSLTSRRTMRFTLTTANAKGYAQCWINRVKVRYKGFKRVKVWTTHRADGVWATWSSGLSAPSGEAATSLATSSRRREP